MRITMKALAVAAALLVCCLPALASAADSSLMDIQMKQSLVLGLDPTFAPMGFEDEDGNIVGFDIDVALEVCARLGVELVCQPIIWEEKEQKLNDKSIDCIWNGLSISPDRMASMQISVPYMHNEMILVVRSDSGIENKADLAGKKLGLQAGSTAEDALAEDASFKASLGQIVLLVDNLEALTELRQGNLDAVLLDLVVADYYVPAEDTALTYLEETMMPEDYGIGFRRADESLMKAVNNALFDMVREGRLAQISVKWFGRDLTTVKNYMD